MPQVFPGLKVFSLNKSFWELLSPCSHCVYSKQEDTPIAQLQKQFFISHHLGKMKIARKNSPILFLFLTTFYHHFFTFYCSVTVVLNKMVLPIAACPAEPGCFGEGFYAKMLQCLEGWHTHRWCSLMGHSLWYFRLPVAVSQVAGT